MDLQTFEQEEVAASMFGSAAAFLVPDTTVTVNFAPDGRAVSGVQHALMGWCCIAGLIMPILNFSQTESSTTSSWHLMPCSPMLL